MLQMQINDNLKEQSKFAVELESEAIYLDLIHNEPVFLWKLSFSDVRLNRNKYESYFGKTVIDEVLRCSGAMCFKDRINIRCGIIVNEDKFDLLDYDTSTFIIYHEIGHIVYKRFDSNKRKNFVNDIISDKYAKACGYRITSNIFKLATWEVNSLIPSLPSHSTRFMTRILKMILYVKHVVKDFVRKYLYL